MEQTPSNNRGLTIHLPPPPSFTNATNTKGSSSPDIPESSSQWKLFDLLKISKKEKPPEPVKEPQTESIVSNCTCCGTVLSYPHDSVKFRCSVCHTTNILSDYRMFFALEGIPPHTISSRYVRKVVERCLNDANQNTQKTLHEIFDPLSKYLYNSFKSYNCLNNSFKVKKDSKKIHYSTSNIHYEDVVTTFNMLTKLPTKRPLFSALQGTIALLKRLPADLGEDARNYSWLLILLEIPFLSHALTHYESGNSKDMIDVKEVKALCYEIIKRVLGVFSNIGSVGVKNYIISWISKYSQQSFVSKVDLINVYISFHLKKYYYVANNPESRGRKMSANASNLDQEYFDNTHLKDADDMNLVSPTTLPLASINLSRSKSKRSRDGSAKVKIYQYGVDWHLTTASVALRFFIEANVIRADNLSASIFYNSLVDYVNLKMDFDSWISNRRFKEQKPSETPELSVVIDYIKGTQNSYSNSATFFFCKYPFLITLGNKISIMDYEAKRVMERKAEEAFINSLDKRIPIDVYFRVKVRRSHIVQDSLNCIKSNQQNLKKSLKVQFLGEAGIDAGGLRKEWFLLLTKSIFHPQTGILVNIEETNYHWFNLVPIDDTEIYYLFGAVLGLAIYNSTILELNFPVAFYKMLLNIPLGFSDFQQLYPTISQNLFKLKTLSASELDSLDLTFEISLQDLFGKTLTKQLVPNGKDLKVTMANRDFYIEKYAKYHLMEGIPKQIETFLKGFNSVTSGNGLSLFSPEEIELLLCGNEEGKLDIDVLKSITKYVGWKPEQKLIDWFWDYLKSLTYTNQKKFLTFVSGSDRIPATGIQNLNFTIKRIGNDSNRLPVAHTCFNELDLYGYATREKLYQKLDMAVHGSSGFGIK